MALKVLASVGIFVVASGVRLTSSTTHSYNAFRKKFNVNRPDDTVSFAERAALFQQQKEKVARHNARPGKLWTAAVNKFADFTEEEFRALLGHRPTSYGGRSSGLSSFMEIHDKADTLVQSVDWRQKANSSQEAKDQGGCGSCWAAAAAGALETHAELAGVIKKVSYEELVDCVENPEECGGTGGCSGATTELAFDYVKNHGIVLAEGYEGYQSGGSSRTCKRPAMGTPALKTSGFVRLPTNELHPLMEAVAKIGPVTVSADAGTWGVYRSGIFDGCHRDAAVNHAILLMGYGTDATLQKDYWLVRNSWGDSWGEGGYIRILRHASDQGEKGFCGTDHRPLDGVGCKGGPETLPVCGMCGILSDSAYPTGVVAA